MVEVVFAAAIFMFAATAVMAMMFATQDAANRAKERVAVVSATASYIEWIRELPYAAVGTPSGNPAASLVASSVVSGPYTITMVPTVEWVSDEKVGAKAYKRLTVTATGTRSGSDSQPLVYVAQTIIKMADVYVPAKPPTVSFGPGSPVERQVIRAQVGVSMEASANGSGLTLATMSMYTGQGTAVQFLIDTSLHSALTSTTEPRATFGPFSWDTRATDIAGNLIWDDGTYSLRVEASDSNGQKTYVARSVIIDNFGPGDVPSMTASPANPYTVDLAWGTAYVHGGRDAATSYEVTGYAQGGSATGGDYRSWSWISVRAPGPATTRQWPATPMSRYFFTSQAVGPYAEYYSPPEHFSPGATAIASPVITPPTLTGRCENRATRNTGTMDTAITITLSPPTFPYTGAMTTVYSAATAAALASPTGVGTVAASPWVYTETRAKSTGKKNDVPPADALYYRTKTVLTPLGYDGGSAQTVWSPIIGPNATAAGGTSF